MNSGLITARIIKKPIRFSSFNYYFTQLHINFLHTQSYLAKAIALADGEIGKNLFNLYQTGDYIIIEGEFLSIEEIKQNTNLVIYVTDVHPAYLIMSK